jgi:rod shape-determining protein MreC
MDSSLGSPRWSTVSTGALDESPSFAPNASMLLYAAREGGRGVLYAVSADGRVRQRLVLDAGSRDGVHVGQAVIDAGGLMGQIIETTPSHATVLLLTDPDHAVPVVVARNGVRLIVYGRGDHLELSDVPLNTDVKQGDVIVSSGLGGRFPAGFPVGTVTGLRADDSRAFLVGELKPAAQLDRGRDVLLLRSAPSNWPAPLSPANTEASAGVALGTATVEDSATAPIAVPASPDTGRAATPALGPVR